MNDLVERGRHAYQKSSAIQMRNGILIVLLGALFFLFGIWSTTHSTWDYFLLAAGALFVVLGVSSIYSAVQFKKKCLVSKIYG